jgi:hypothetical protein
MTTMSARDWILQLLVGGLFGALGQAIRVVVGMKKLHDKAVHQRQAFAEVFHPGTLALSLLMGFVAGTLGSLAQTVNLAAISARDISLLVGIGYAGADCIEGFVRKSLPAGVALREEEEDPPAPAQTPAPPAAAVPVVSLTVAPEIDLLPPVG